MIHSAGGRRIDRQSGRPAAGKLPQAERRRRVSCCALLDGVLRWLAFGRIQIEDNLDPEASQTFENARTESETALAIAGGETAEEIDRCFSCDTGDDLCLGFEK